MISNQQKYIVQTPQVCVHACVEWKGVHVGMSEYASLYENCWCFMLRAQTWCPRSAQHNWLHIKITWIVTLHAQTWRHWKSKSLELQRCYSSGNICNALAIHAMKCCESFRKLPPCERITSVPESKKWKLLQALHTHPNTLHTIRHGACSASMSNQPCHMHHIGVALVAC